uniref:Uncharacterized protein n=1 Tax=Timema monikensis TaxID=170555 RepID=A0A7R9DZA9_9NEOP|nr:unnamed protein product [Timema monikensis]
MLKAMVAGQVLEAHNNDMYCSPVSQYDYYPEFYPQGLEMCPAHGQIHLHGDYERAKDNVNLLQRRGQSKHYDT